MPTQNRAFEWPPSDSRWQGLGSARQAEMTRIMDDNLSHYPDGPNREQWFHFLLPLVEMGLTGRQIHSLIDKMPAKWPFDHREVYFDFRLQTWMRILEIPTLEECLQDYVQSAESTAEGLEYLSRKIRAFFARHHSDSPV